MLTGSVVADIFRPGQKKRAVLYDAAVILAGAMLIGLSAQVKLLLPFSPVPVTGQTFAVLMLGSLLGARRGAACVVLYIAEGAAGVPVFAAGLGPAALIGPTGGYLVGFAAAAWLTGKLAELGWNKRVHKTILAMLLGNSVIYIFGVSWLAVLTGFKTALATGLYPFLAGDILKILLAAVLLPTGWKLLEKLSFPPSTNNQ